MEPDLQLCGHPPVVPRGEPLENSLCLPFPGGYYLTSAYGALSLIKNFQEEQAARLLSSEARDTLRQWHKRRTTNRTVPSVDDFQVRGQQPGWAQLLPHGPCGSGTSPTPPPAPLCLIIQWKGDILPPPDKDLESPSSTRLEALVPSRDSRARTRSPSPRAWRPDFPGAAREAP